MPSIFRKLLSPKQSSSSLKRASKSTTKPSGATGVIKRWTSRNSNGTSCSLPPEIVLKILETAWSNDTQVAATCSLLCKAVLERTRRHLYTSPTLHSVGQINYFLRTIKKNASLASRVTSAVLNGANAGSNRMGTGERMRGAVTTRLPQLLELCPNLQELALKDAIVFSLTDFSHADALLHLTLDGTLLSDRTTTQRYQKFYTPLKNLATLTLRATEFDLSTADHFLSPRTLPAVVAVELEGCRLVDHPASLVDLGVYEPRRLAANLELLVLKVSKNTFPTPEDLATIAEVLPKCTNLRALEIEAAYLTPHTLENLPLSLTHLSLLVAPSPFPDLFQPNMDAAQALSNAFLSLSMAVATSTLSSTSPFGSASPLGRSHLASSSFTPTPLALSPFGTPAPSPPLTQTPQRAVEHPLSKLVYLRLPRCWELEADCGWKEPEFASAVKRITRESRTRKISVEYARRAERKMGRIVRGKELRDELDVVRKSLVSRQNAQEDQGYTW
ncbi:hypothetical protein JCM16303_003582 [Sporobolomyces ruberrimus]